MNKILLPMMILLLLVLGVYAREQIPGLTVAVEVPIHTVQPTSTAQPTHTPLPTETPIPTATFTPSPTPFVPPVFTPFPEADQGAIVMDGFVDDWARFEPLFVDTAGDAGASGVDITEIYAAHTDTHLLFSIHLGKVVDIEAEQALQITMQLGDREIRYNFGDRIGRLDGASVRQAELGVESSPTVTSDVFEISFPHEGAFDQPVMVLFSDPAEGGDIASPDGAPLVYDWRNPIESAPPRSIDKPEGTIRLVSWNILRDNIFDRNLGVTPREYRARFSSSSLSARSG